MTRVRRKIEYERKKFSVRSTMSPTQLIFESLLALLIWARLMLFAHFKWNKRALKFQSLAINCVPAKYFDREPLCFMNQCMAFGRLFGLQRKLTDEFLMSCCVQNLFAATDYIWTCAPCSRVSRHSQTFRTTSHSNASARQHARFPARRNGIRMTLAPKPMCRGKQQRMRLKTDTSIKSKKAVKISIPFDRILHKISQSRAHLTDANQLHN